MTSEEKRLLLKDLCARLPYGVEMKYKDEPNSERLCQIDTFYTDVDGFHCLLRTTGPFGGFQDLNELKPYLRLMSSMTEEEKREFHHIASLQRNYADDGVFYTHWQMNDWLNKNYFDYRGLIEKGFALEAPEGMY